MRGLLKLHNAANTAAAWDDWNKIYIMARNYGKQASADGLAPKPGSGWRTIDKQIAKLRKVLESTWD